MINKLAIPKIFEPLYTGALSLFREIFFKGGRGSGKTQNVVTFLALKFITEANSNILCLREFAKSTGDSVKAEFDAFFQDNNFDSMIVENGVIKHIEKHKNKQTIIKIYTTTIINTTNNNKIIFAGVTKHTVKALKSIKGIKYCFIDEADFMEEEVYRILKPTIRADNSQIICCFNPKSDEDYIYKLSQEPNARRYVCDVNYKDNPFFPKVLDDDRLDDLKNLPYPIYAHVWLGHTLENIEGIIFSKETIDLMLKAPKLKTFYRERYSIVCIACDPATTSKDFSNEYGIIVLGLTYDSIVEVIDDLSANITPEQFSSIVDSAYSDYSCDYVVVEVNQGGDFIKHSLLTKNPLLVIKEVRAIKDKVNRATPIANVCSLGKVLLINQNRDSLVRQMKRLTNMGYFGAKGESPDRLDAFVWGVYDLLKIGDLRTEGIVFKHFMLKAELRGLLFKKDIAVLYNQGGDFGLIIGDIYKNHGESIFKVNHAIKGEMVNFDSLIHDIRILEIYCNDVVIGRGLNIKGLIKKSLYKLQDINEIALGSLATLMYKVNVVECEESYFNGIKDNLLLKDLLKYQAENKESETPLVCAFCGLLTLI